MSYARVNWKAIQEQNGASLTDLLDKPLKRKARRSWSWNQQRRRSVVKFTPNTATTVRPEEVYTNKNTTHEKDRRACTVNALAIAGRVPWFVSSKLLQQAGRKLGKGFNIDQAIHRHRIPGFVFRKLRRGRVTLGRFLARHPVGRFLVTTSCHAFVVEHGKVLDWNFGLSQRSIVCSAYTVRPDRSEV